VAAFARGMSPSTLVWDVPSSPTAVSANPDGKFHGPLRLRSALANDWLAPINGVLLQIGPGSVWQLAEPLGLHGLAGSANPSTLLQSGGGASLVELAQAYGVLAEQGTLAGATSGSDSSILPVAVLSVADSQGQNLFEQGAPETRPVLSPQLAYLVHNVLSDEPARWPSLGYPNPLEIGRPAGAKGGRADNDRQVWAAGYTRQLTAIVWIGLPADASAGERLDPGAAAGLWHALVQYTERDVPPTDWDQPAGISTVDVCDPSGLLPTASCPSRVSEVFLNGNEPTGLDNLYISVQINRETGLLATVFTPPELTEDRVYLNLPPEAQAWGRLAGLPVPPSDYDRIQPPAPQPDVQISSPALFTYIHGKISISGTASGANFASYRLQAGAGLNPSQWIEIGSGTAPLKSSVLGQWDTAGQDGLFAVRLQVVRQNQQIETAVIQVTVDNTPPAVQVTSPQPGETISAASGSLLFQVDASDNVGLQQIDFSLDGKSIGSASKPPYSLSWPSLTPGEHTLVVTATDLAGNSTQSAPVNFFH
jgi:membrane carboxypeptidase/penicillin-binding protein PbpC